jgi:predicted nuclease with TOPRIM domain
MREQIKNRLESLAAEYRTGQKMLAELEERQASVKLTLTRISGAIQVLEELLQENDPAAETTENGAANADRRAAA